MYFLALMMSEGVVELKMDPGRVRAGLRKWIGTCFRLIDD